MPPTTTGNPPESDPNAQELILTAAEGVDAPAQDRRQRLRRLGMIAARSQPTSSPAIAVSIGGIASAAAVGSEPDATRYNPV
jgi:hypothetical protein